MPPDENDLDRYKANLDTLNKELGPEQVKLLLSFFSGGAMAAYSIEHEQAVEAVNSLRDVISHEQRSDGDFSLSYGIKRLSECLELMESPALQHYNQYIKDLSRHDLMPAHKALQAISNTLEEAEKNKKNRDPQKRKEIAAQLRKIPIGLDYVLGQMTSMYSEFDAIQKRFKDECRDREELYGNNLPENERNEHEIIASALKAIETTFSRSYHHTSHLRSVHMQIKKRASNLEKEFMAPPSTEASLGVA